MFPLHSENVHDDDDDDGNDDIDIDDDDAGSSLDLIAEVGEPPDISESNGIT